MKATLTCNVCGEDVSDTKLTHECHHNEGCVKCGGFKWEPCEPPAWRDNDFEFFNLNPSPTQIRDYMAEVRKEVREQERQFILNILDGIDMADGKGNTKAIRTCLAARVV